MVGSDEERFTAMYRANYAAVRSYATLLAASSDVDDVVAETFAVAWRRFGEVATQWSRGWLLATARNVARNGRRRAQRAERFLDRLKWLTHTAVPESTVTVGELDSVRRGLAQLSEGDQELLVLAGWLELSIDELAEVLAVSKNTASVRLHRARARLREAVAARDDGEVA